MPERADCTSLERGLMLIKGDKLRSCNGTRVKRHYSYLSVSQAFMS